MIEQREHAGYNQDASAEACKEHHSNFEDNKGNHSSRDDSYDDSCEDIFFRQFSSVPDSTREDSACDGAENADCPSHQRNGNSGQETKSD